MRQVVIVGAGQAGHACARALRAEGFDGTILLLGAEPLPPYERPPLSKEVLLEEALPEIPGLLPSLAGMAEWRGGVEVTAIDRDRRRLRIPIFDGTQAETAFGVESVPRFVLVDSRGVVKWTFCGVGAETGYSLREQLERLLSPTSPNAATGTTGTTAPAIPGLMPPR
jgi:hypothetical protein